MEEIAQQFHEELQELIDRYKARLSVPRIMHVAQDVLHKTLSVKHNPELHAKLNVETMKEMAKEYANHNRHYEIAKRENGADYAKEVSNVTIEQAYLDGCCATYKGGWDKCKGCGMYNGDTKCID